MQSVVIRHSGRPDLYAIALRSHDMGGTDYETLITLERKDALAIAGPHTGLYFLFDDVPTPAEREAEKHALVIERIPDRKPGTLAWRMRIGGEIAARVDYRDGVRKMLHLSDGDVKTLMEHIRVEFADGPPDWELRSVEDMEDRAIRMEREAAEARENASAARAAWEAKQDSSPEPA